MPTVDADRVYVLWQDRDSSPLVALDHDGRELWRYELGPYLHGQGGATSPILFENLVVIGNDHSAGSALVAVDRATGQEVWKIPRGGERNVVAIRPASSGTPTTEAYRVQRTAPHVPTPLVYHDRLFLRHGSGRARAQCRLLWPATISCSGAAQAARPVWR